MTIQLEVRGAGKRHPRGWALRDCDLTVDPSTVTALIGPNGAGKSTLMAAAAGLTSLTTGEILVNGRPAGRAMPPELGYLAQDAPLYRRWRVADMVDQTADLNTSWDAPHAARLIDEAGIDPDIRVGSLSGGQRARLALALVLGKRPALVLLDEPLAGLDPLARLQVQQTLMAEVATTGMTVLMSSHILGDVQDTCDDLVLLQDGRVTLRGPVDVLISRHRLLTGPPADPAALGWLKAPDVVEVRSSLRQTTVLVSAPPPGLPAGWTDQPATLDEIVIARLRATTQPGHTQEGAA